MLNRVVPIDNQQIAFTLGGPFCRDRLHFFGHFEYEREPRTSIWNTPYPRFNVELEGNDTVKTGRRASRLPAVAGDAGDGEGRPKAASSQPFGAGQQQHPAATGSHGRRRTASISVSSRRC